GLPTIMKVIIQVAFSWCSIEQEIKATLFDYHSLANSLSQEQMFFDNGHLIA
ncbi:13499_t:CDS:1, partial [Acaulospora morrowiae]